MAERWKLNAARALEQLAHGVEKLADELERYNDEQETVLITDPDGRVVDAEVDDG